MSASTRLANRRRVLKGILGGATISVALPLLDGFLNTNGTAMAATGAPLPVRFGTWFWTCGLGPGRWQPKTLGTGYEMSEHLKSLAPFTDRLCIFSGMNVSLDGSTFQPHWSGAKGCSAGEVLENLPSIDVLVADAVGSGTRFRSLEASATAGKGAAANTVNSLSRRNATLINPPEPSPVALYTRIFGPDFHDPNATDFKPDPRIMVRKSVLSAIEEPRNSLIKDLGAADRVRLDEYFTSLRQLEHQVSLELEKPAPLAACTVPKAPMPEEGSTDVESVIANHAALAGLLAHALACDQTRVVNMYFTGGEMHRIGDPTTHHTNTHEEPSDSKLGYQVKVSWYEERIMQGFAAFLTAMNSVKEGDGTLLDHSLIYAFTDCGFAKAHTLENLPMFLAGRAGGRLKSGIHLADNAGPVTRVGLTIQQVMGMSAGNWGTGSMATSRAFSEVIA